MSQDDWNKQLGLYHKWAIDVGAWESGKNGVDSRISRYESADHERGLVLPEQMPLAEEITEALQDLRNKLKVLQGLVAGNPSDSGVHDFDGIDGSGSTESNIKDYFGGVEYIILGLNSFGRLISQGLAFYKR